jgi:hypothetical protein
MLSRQFSQSTINRPGCRGLLGQFIYSKSDFLFSQGIGIFSVFDKRLIFFSVEIEISDT